MSKKRTYSQKLQDPRWQKKRLEILSRDDFACVLCGDKETTLHVHHVSYIKGNEPWDYPDKKLKTLCKYCHKREHTYGDTVINWVNDLIENGDLLPGDLFGLVYTYINNAEVEELVNKLKNKTLSELNTTYKERGQ